MTICHFILLIETKSIDVNKLIQTDIITTCTGVNFITKIDGLVQDCGKASSPEGYPRETPWTGEEAAALWRQPEPHTHRQLNWACVVVVGFISKLRFADDSLIYSCALGCYMYLDWTIPLSPLFRAVPGPGARHQVHKSGTPLQTHIFLCNNHQMPC